MPACHFLPGRRRIGLAHHLSSVTCSAFHLSVCVTILRHSAVGEGVLLHDARRFGRASTGQTAPAEFSVSNRAHLPSLLHACCS